MKKKNNIYTEIVAKAESYLANNGYGSGTNYTTTSVAWIMALFAKLHHQQKLEEVKDDVAEKLQDLFGLIDDHKGGYWINGNAQKKIGDFLVWYASLTQEK